MSTAAGDNLKYEFGSFRLDPAERLLLRDGIVVPLTPKAFDLLVYLVERQGHLAEKQALLSALWPDAIVEEANLAFQISGLRKALADGADGEALIQTVPTKGYRFVAPVTVASASGPSTWATRHRAALAAVFIITLGGALGIVAWFAAQHPETQVATPPTEPVLTRLTANPSDLSLTSALMSPDGRYLAYADPTGVHLRQINTGETTVVPETKGMDVIGWTGDSAKIRAGECSNGACVGWSVPIVGGSRQRSGASWLDIDGVEIAPDGSRMLRMHRDGAIEVGSLTGNDAGVTARRDGFVRGVSATFSRDGSELFVADEAAEHIERFSQHDATQSRLFTAPKGWEVVRVGPALSGGRLLFVMGRGRSDGFIHVPDQAVWEIGTDPAHAAAKEPRRVSEWREEEVEQLSASDDGTRLGILSTASQWDVYVARFDAQRARLDTPVRLTLDERSDTASAWSPDSSTVIFYSFRNGNSDLFTQRVDSTTAEPLVVAPGNQDYPKMVSDGTVIYTDSTRGPLQTIMRVPLSGGQSVPVVEAFGGVEHCAFHGRCIVIDFKDGAVSALDPLRGRGKRLFTSPQPNDGATLSPDGNRMAFILPAQGVEPIRIRIVSFEGAPAEDIVVKHATRLRYLDWHSTGEGFFSTDVILGHSRLLFITWDGETHVLWEPPGLQFGWITPAPDGKHLAINVLSRKSNAWLLTGLEAR